MQKFWNSFNIVDSKTEHEFHTKNCFDKILIVHSNIHIGDQLICTPTVRRLRELHPSSEITMAFIEDQLEIYKNNPNISKFILLDKDSLLPKSNTNKIFDYVFCLSEMRPNDDNVLKNVRYNNIYRNFKERAIPLGLRYAYRACTVIDEKYWLYYGSEDIKWANRIIGDRKRFTVLIAPDSRYDYKKINSDFFDDLVWHLNKLNIRVIVVRPPKGIKNKKFELIDKNSILQIASLVDRGVNMVISADSLVAHIAAAYSKNQIVINNYMWNTHPFNEKCIVIYGKKIEETKKYIDYVFYRKKDFKRMIVGEPIADGMIDWKIKVKQRSTRAKKLDGKFVEMFRKDKVCSVK